MPTVKRGVLGASVALVALALLTGTALAQGYVYPARGQSPQQQQKDQGECQAWAMQQPGANPAAVPPPQGPQGEMARGAARGAAVGAVGGAIGGDAGKGAAIGAASGAMIGGMRRRDQQRAAQQQQADANASFGRAYSACLEARGYSVK